MIEEVIFKLLTLDGNETYLIGDYYKGFKYSEYRKLVIELVKKRYDVRFCSLDNCSCHPEYILRELIKNKDLIKFLESNMGGYFKHLVDIINEDYESVSIYDNTQLREGFGG